MFLLFTNLAQGLWGRSPTLSRKILAWERLEAEIIHPRPIVFEIARIKRTLHLYECVRITFKLKTHFGKRDTARDQILAESCGEISVLIWEVLVLPFFAPFTQYIIIIHIPEHDSSPSKYCFTKNKLNYLGEKVNLVSLKMICLVVPSNHCIAEFHQLLRISEETRFGQSEWI